jgi:hypothetical protein
MRPRHSQVQAFERPRCKEGEIIAQTERAIASLRNHFFAMIVPQSKADILRQSVVNLIHITAACKIFDTKSTSADRSQASLAVGSALGG